MAKLLWQTKANLQAGATTGDVVIVDTTELIVTPYEQDIISADGISDALAEDMDIKGAPASDGETPGASDIHVAGWSLQGNSIHGIGFNVQIV